MKMRRYLVVMTGTYELPADLNEREDMYGTSDPLQCVQIDIDNDIGSFMLDLDDVELTSVDPVHFDRIVIDGALLAEIVGEDE